MAVLDNARGEKGVGDTEDAVYDRNVGSSLYRIDARDTYHVGDVR